MSRYSGPQESGAAAKLHHQRRLEAEARQREERERDARRRAEEAAAPPVRPLTIDERAELLYAAVKLQLAQELNALGVPWPIAKRRAGEIASRQTILYTTEKTGT